MLLRLSSTDMSLSEKNYSEFNALSVYNTKLIKLNSEINKRINQKHANDFRWRKYVFLLHHSDKLKKNVSKMSFIREKPLIYYIDQLIDVKRLCVLKDYVRKRLNIAHNSEHFEYAKTHNILIKSWYIYDLTKLLKIYI